MLPGTPLLSTLDARVEAAVFAAGRPVTEQELAALLPDGADVHESLNRIAIFWEGRGVFFGRTGEGWVARARKEIVPSAGVEASRRLSRAAIATLAVIAMHQPVTVAQIEKVRAVKLGRGMLEGLKDAGLVTEVGRRSGSGQAPTYGVTLKFLETFDLQSLADMPTPEEAFALDVLDQGVERS